VQKWKGREGEDGWILDFDQSMFDVISGVYQMNKIIFSNFLPGSFVSGLLEVITEKRFLPCVIDFAIQIT